MGGLDIMAKQTSLPEKKLLSKVRAALSLTGKTGTTQALILFYTLKAPETPNWCRSVALASLGYFISLIDAIPDLTPVLGYTDDISVMAAAIATIAVHISPEIKLRAKIRAADIFGVSPSSLED